MISGSIDIHNFLSKLPFGTTPLNEKHYIIRPGKTTSFLGPQTKLNLRCTSDSHVISENGIPKEINITPHDWSKPVNKIDETAMIHDFLYKNAEEESNETKILNDKHNADIFMLNALEEIKTNTFSDNIPWVEDGRFLIKLIKI